MKTAFLTLALAAALLAGAPAGSAAVLTYQAQLNGPAESPPNASPGSGLATVVIDDVASTIHLNVSFSGLLGVTSASHIHCCTATPLTGLAGVATTTPSFPGFPAGVYGGTYDNTFDLLAPGTYNPAFLTAAGGTPLAAQAMLLGGIAAQQAYLNIHTSAFPGGEIRAFLAPVPEPSAFAMLCLGIAGLGLYLRRRA